MTNCTKNIDRPRQYCTLGPLYNVHAVHRVPYLFNFLQGDFLSEEIEARFPPNM
jgi:hypothetical protein